MITPLQTILSELRARLELLYGDRLERLVLYGSQARGDAEPDSDIDVLVVLKGEVDARKELDATLEDVVELCAKYDCLITCLFVSDREFDRKQSPIMINIRREGVSL